MTSTLSIRGAKSVAGLDIPWRFAPSSNLYDKITNPSGIITFATAEIGGVQRQLEEFVARKVKIPGDAFLYKFSSAGGPRFPNALASFLNDHFQPFAPVTGNHIIVGSGVTAIENTIAFSLGDSGDGVLVSAPIYGRFELDFGNEAGLHVVYADMDGVDSFDEAVVSRFEQAIVDASVRGIKIRALLISNPSNPLGQCYPRNTLRALLAFCHTQKIHLISDEIYALSVFDSGNQNACPFTSVLSFDTEGLINSEYIHVLYGMSKDFGAAGLRLGCMITRNHELIRACMSMIRFHNPSGPSIAIGTAILEDREFVSSFLQTCKHQLAVNFRLATTTLDEYGINYRRGSNAGLFIYIDLSPYLSPPSWKDEKGEFGLAHHLVRHGVFLHPGEEHSPSPGWFRLVFASHDKDTLAEGLRRLTYAISKCSSA